ncbi:MAG TPA: malate dehydrogenase [Nitrososphaerales archaeon]
MIAIIGSGRVGTSIALQLISRELDDITLVDIVKGLPQGEALDLGHTASEMGSDVSISGSNDYADIKGANIVIVTAGLARKPGMSRLDLTIKNAEIIKPILLAIKLYAPNSKVLMVTNPLDVMTYVAFRTTGFPRGRVFGMGGMLDLSRLKYALALKLGMSRASIRALVIGEHGDNMVPLARYASVGGIPITSLLSKNDLDKAAEDARKIAAEVIELKGATNFAPGNGVAGMLESIARDRKTLVPASTYLEGEYGVKGICIGVPVILGSSGIEKIVQIDLNEEEKSRFMEGVKVLKEAVSSIPL